LNWQLRRIYGRRRDCYAIRYAGFRYECAARAAMRAPSHPSKAFVAAMISVAVGTALLAGTAGAFWSVLPRQGRVHRLVESVWGPYVGIAITSGFAIGIVMVLAGILSFLG
jgi:hypothetical protein